MSSIAARFFRHLQAAPFYQGLHQDAVALLGPGQGRTWHDWGCGPGLVAHLAAAQGYQALGLDQSAAMVQAAPRANSHARFQVADLNHVQGLERADVVSAASLLYVHPNPQQALRQLLAQTKPQGHILIIETSPAMTLKNAWHYWRSAPQQKHAHLLLLWAAMRNGRHANIRKLVPEQYPITYHGILQNLIGAWIIHNSEAA